MRDLQQNKAVLSVPRVRRWAGPGLNNCILQHDGSLRRSAALPVRSVSVRDWGILRGLIMLRGSSERPQQSQVHLVLCLPLCPSFTLQAIFHSPSILCLLLTDLQTHIRCGALICLCCWASWLLLCKEKPHKKSDLFDFNKAWRPASN